MEAILRRTSAISKDSSASAVSSGHRLAELDGLRGIAILTIIVFHYFFLEGGAALARNGPFIWRFEKQLNNVGQFGWVGVDLFFVLSGFLIGGILLDSRGATNYFAVFYRRRVHRILPAYLLVCFVAGLVWISGITQGTPAHPWLYEERIPWYAYLTFVQNALMVKFNAMSSRMIDATWSLAIEEQFYIVLPLLLWAVRPRFVPYVILAGILLAPVLRFVVFFGSDPATSGTAIYLSTYCRMDALFWGVLAAWCLRQPRWREHLLRSERLCRLIAGVLASGVAYMAVRGWGFTHPILMTVGLSWIATFFTLILVEAVMRPGRALSKVLRSRSLGSVGGLAYALYLFHQPVLGLMHLLFRHDSPRLTGAWSFLVTLMSVVVVFALAKISWKLLEGPLVRRGRSVAYTYAEASSVSGISVQRREVAGSA